MNSITINLNSLHDTARLVYEIMYNHGDNNKTLLDAYAYAVNHNNIKFSYDEIKDYLFHHNFN